MVVTDDEVSEREEVRDSNYIGTDLYWENRFYQVRPFKQPDADSGTDEVMMGVNSETSLDPKDHARQALLSEEIKDKEFVMV